MQYKDLTFVDTKDGKYLVMSCDVSAGFGFKESDLLACDPKITGAMCMRVNLLEFLALKITPLCLSHLVGNDFESTGQYSLMGIQEELAKAGFKDLIINGSSETNMTPKSTCIGVSLIGIVDKKVIDAITVMKGDLIYRLGTPFVGQAVLDNLNHLVSYDQIKIIANSNLVRTMSGVGSKGFLYEANLLGDIYGVTSHIEVSKDDLELSAGPSTSIIIVVAAKEKKAFEKAFEKCEYIGYYD